MTCDGTFARSSKNSARLGRETPFKNRHGAVKLVLRLTEGHALRTVEHGVLHVAAADGGQVVEKDRARGLRDTGHQFGSYAIALKFRKPVALFFRLAHGLPARGIDSIDFRQQIN